MLNIDDEFLMKIVDLGQLQYPCDKCINILNLSAGDAKVFEVQFTNLKSETRQAWEKGKDKADFDIDTKLLLLAKAGDMKAIELIEDRIYSRNRAAKAKKNAIE